MVQTTIIDFKILDAHLQEKENTGNKVQYNTILS